MESNPITRAALGNIASLGALYDGRHDIFTGLSIFKRTIPEEALTSTDADFSDIQLIHSDDFSDKFHKLDVKAELQVSVLAGLFKLEGSGHYLQDQKKSARTVKSSLLYNIKTKDENVNLFHENLRNAFAVEAIECGMATHVVVGITWGANSVLSCEYQNKDGKDVNKIEGSLTAHLQKMSLQIKGKSDVNYDDGDVLNSSNFQIRIYGDVLPSSEDLPTDVQGSLRLMKQMPSLVSKCNNGKGKPLTYKLIPITLLQKYLNFALKCDTVLKSLEEASLLRVVKLFDEFLKTKQKVHDFYEDVLKHRYCVLDEHFRNISSLKEELNIEESKWRTRLATVLVKVRSGEIDASKIDDFIKEFHTGQFSSQNVDVILAKSGDLIKKINFAKNVVANGAKYIGSGIDIDDQFLEDFDFKVYVLYYTHASSRDTQVWTRNRQIYFQELKRRSESCKAYVVDCDIHPTLSPQGKSSCIQVVRKGQLLSEDLRLQEEQHKSVWFSPDDFSSANELNIIISEKPDHEDKNNWVNAFVNYLKFPTLDKAEQSDLITVIPSEFKVFNKDLEEYLVKTKTNSHKAGKCAKQEKGVYSLTVGCTTVRLIYDEPEPSFIKQLDKIHGVCVLINFELSSSLREFVEQTPDGGTMDDGFKNVMFCFANAFGSSYHSANTLHFLKNALQKKRGEGYGLSAQNVYFVDIEAYRFLAAVKNNPPVKFPENARDEFAQSWIRSSQELLRLLHRVAEIKPVIGKPESPELPQRSRVQRYDDDDGDEDSDGDDDD